MKDGEKNIGVEVKNGPTAKLNKNQTAQHAATNSGDTAVLHGGNAEKAQVAGQTVDHSQVVHVEDGQVTKWYCVIKLPGC